MTTKLPTLPNQVLASKRPEKEATLASLHMAAVLAGFEWFASEGRIFQVFSDKPGDFENVGSMQERFGGGGMEQVLDESNEVDPTTLLTKAEGPSIFVFDDFYAKPLDVRVLALKGELAQHPERHKGARSPDMPINDVLREAFASVLYLEPKSIRGYTAFQLNVAGDQRVFHSDTQRWAAAVYLTPDAPIDAGLSFYRSRTTRVRSGADIGKNPDVPALELESLTYGGSAILDRTRWQEVDRVGNIFNRLVVWDARLVHSVSEPFGLERQSGRLAQLFFFDVD